MVSPRRLAFAAILLTASTISARANDEIQVYNAEIAKVGQWTFQLHSNYAFIGRKEPDFPGGLIPNHALQGTGEWAYGITDWWEMGFYTPYARRRRRDDPGKGLQPECSHGAVCHRGESSALRPRAKRLEGGCRIAGATDAVRICRCGHTFCTRAGCGSLRQPGGRSRRYRQAR